MFTSRNYFQDINYKSLQNITEIQEIFNILNDAKSKKLFDYKENEIVVLLGLSGMENNNLGKLLASYDTLESMEMEENFGDFNIIDTEKHIYKPIIFPELLKNDKENLMIYVCPGFSDMRKSGEDIAVTYFIKKAIDQAKNVKILITINYSLVKPGAGMDHLMKLLKHVNELIRDIEKYRNSIALVVTQVDNEYIKTRNGLELVSDKTVVKKIATFLKNFHQYVPQFISSNKQITFYETLLQNLIQNNTGILSVLRKPDRSGSVSRINIIQDGKNQIKQIIENNIDFVTRSDDDIGFTLSESSMVFLNEMALEINERVKMNILEISKKIQYTFQQKEKDTEFFFKFKSDVVNFGKKLKISISKLEEMKQVKIFMMELIDILECTFISVPKENIANIMYLEEYITFLETITNKEMIILSTEWVEPLKKTYEYLIETKDWYTFLYDLNSFLSSHKVQRDVSFYNVADVNNWGSGKHTQGININKDNLNLFLNKIKDSRVFDFNNFNEDNIDQVKINRLNQILISTLKHKPMYSEHGTKLIVRGDFVKLTTIGGILEYKDIKELEIYATNTIFIDRDFDKTGEKFQMTIISPKWVIFGGRKLIFDGQPAIHQSPPTAKSGHNKLPGDGLPGFLGGSAGSFLGIGREFINDKGLILLARGGAGGNAQHGENTNFNYIGGKGGKKGLGGCKGNLTVINTQGKLEIPMFATKGKDGIPGKGGQGTRARGADNSNENQMQHRQCPIDHTHIPILINTYKSFIRENINDPLKQETLTTFIDELEKYPFIKNQYFTLDFLDEFQSLEYDRLNKKFTNYKTFYQSLLMRIKEYSKKPNGKEFQSRDHKKVLDYLFTAILSILSIMENYPTGTLIIDMKSYLELARNKIEEFEREQKITALANYRIDVNKKYKIEIDSKIIEGNSIITNQIKPEIDAIHKEINNKIYMLLEEIKELSMRVKEENEKLKAKKRELEVLIALKGILQIFQFIGTVVSFIGGLGSIVGPVIAGASTILQSTLKTDSTIEHVKIPIAVQNLLSTAGNIKQSTQKYKRLGVLQEQLKKLSEESEVWNERQKIHINNSSQKANLPDAVDNYKRIKTELFNSLAIKNKKEKRSIQYEQYIEQQIPRQKSFNYSFNNKMKRSANANSYEQKLTYLENAVSVAEISVDIYNNVKTDLSSLKEVNDAIKRTEETMKHLKQFEEAIVDKVLPMLAGIEDDLKIVQDNLKNKTRVYLIVSKWHIQTLIHDLKLQLEKLTAGFKVQANLVREVEKLEEAMNTLISVFDQIQQYQENKRLADYVADITSPAVQESDIKDDKLKEAVKQLDVIIKTNELMYQVETVTRNLKQHVFPFPYLFLDDFNLSSNNTNIVLSKVKNQINKMEESFKMYNAVTGYFDKYINNAEFNSDIKTLKPFYVWRNNEHKKEISELLEGKMIFIKADVAKTTLNAVKFKLIEIQLKLSNQNLKNKSQLNTLKLKEELEYFLVEMTHLGNSYYKCEDKFYIISHLPQMFKYSFQKNEKGIPMERNQIYDKINKGDISLSPFAMWSVKLIPGLPEHNFTKLSQYKELVDIELVGKGRYISSDLEVCKDDLTNYYKEEIIMDRININPRAKRNQRSLIQTDQSKTASSNAGKFSSPINNIINWIKIMLLSHGMSTIERIGEWFTNYERKYKFENLNEVTTTDPSIFYNYIDNSLILAPIALHLWGKKFKNKKNLENVRFIEISKSNRQVWIDFIQNAQRLLCVLEKYMGEINQEIVWYREILETILANITYFSKQIQIDDTNITDLNQSLLAFSVDIFDDILYHESFKTVRQKQEVIIVARGLLSNLEKLPYFKKLIKSVQCKYKIQLQSFGNYKYQITNLEVHLQHMLLKYNTTRKDLQENLNLIH